MILSNQIISQTNVLIANLIAKTSTRHFAIIYSTRTKKNGVVLGDILGVLLQIYGIRGRVILIGIVLE
jgi:hypothetical protein